MRALLVLLIAAALAAGGWLLWGGGEPRGSSEEGGSSPRSAGESPAAPEPRREAPPERVAVFRLGEDLPAASDEEHWDRTLVRLDGRTGQDLLAALEAHLYLRAASRADIYALSGETLPAELPLEFPLVGAAEVLRECGYEAHLEYPVLYFGRPRRDGGGR